MTTERPAAIGIILLTALLSGCGAEPAAVTAAAHKLEQARKTIVALQTENTELKRQLGAEKVHVQFLRDTRDQEDAERRRTAVSSEDGVSGSAPVRAVAMCYKDYCPCDPPQGGPDSVLCDQLEEGIRPEVDLMIAGRGMREARRQIATGDYQ